MRQMDTRRMCPHCRAFITTDDKTCPYCNEKVGQRAIDRRSPSPILGGLIPHAQFTTVIILLINAGIFIATYLNMTLLEAGGSFRAAIRAGQFWRLVTAGFFHGGILHIGMNSWVLFDVGSQVEEVYGASRMLVIYFVGTALGFYLSSVWQAGLSVGSSAGIMGLIGAMIALSLHHRSAVTEALRGQYIRWVIYMLLIGLLPGLHIDNAAHVGGLAGGFGMAYLTGLPRWEGSPQDRIWRIVSYACMLVTAYCFFEMYRWFTAIGQQL
jgi:rhomboid protease GluP